MRERTMKWMQEGRASPIQSLRRSGTVIVFLLLFCTAALAAAGSQHAAHGLVLKADPTRRTMVVSCEEIPGFMAAMDMPFSVQDRSVFTWLKPGALIRFTIVDTGRQPRAENIQRVVNFEPEPADAGALAALSSALHPSGGKPLEPGQAVPDFALTDQAAKVVKLSDFRGKVIALTFGYSRCPYPTYCLRLSNNLAEVEKRFHARVGRDLVLMTIAIDPDYDKGTVLADYARSFHADARVWHFLTGPLPEVQAVAARFGMNFWRSEGLLTHNLHTVIIDRQGRLAANVDGNQFTARQLGDLVNTVMDGRD